MASTNTPRFRVVSHSAEAQMARIQDRAGNTTALVLTGVPVDAHQMAAGPDLYDRLLELLALRTTVGDGGHSHPLLPPEVRTTIELALRQARGEV